MSPEPTAEPNRPGDAERRWHVQRRGVLAAGASLGATLIAGCTTDTDPNGTDGDAPSGGGSDGPSENAGTFRLLISDQPVAIGDFDALNVSFDRARIFRGGGTGTDEAEETETATPTGTETATATETASATETPTPTAIETASDDEAADDGEQQGFFVIDLEGATVDLTTVVGEKAIGVFEGELEEGRYTKVELYAADVEGIVNEEPVDVKIPSGKLQIVKPFEVVAGETLTFVFDINVVKKGPNGYNLLPVISESGVAGEDVEVTVVEDEDGEDDEETETEETETEEDEKEGDGEDGDPPTDAGNQP